MATDLTDWLWALAATYFKPVAIGGVIARDWTSEFDPLCTFTGSDDERIAALRRSRSVASRFAPAKITFEDLWTANADKLSRVWPGNNGKPYDASSADQSFFNHLAYGFGNNCDAMERVAGRTDCALRREKWDRPDYLRGTILKAVAIPKQWKALRGNAAPLAVGTTPTAPLAVGTTPTAPQSVVPAAPSAPVLDADSAGILTMNGKLEFDSNLKSLVYMLGKQTEVQIGFDEFYDRVMFAPIGGTWRPITDNDMVQLRETFERKLRFAPVGKDLMRDALELVASWRHFDSAITWLDGLVWDGVPRVEQFLAAYCGTVDDEYTRAVSLYMWTGLAGRILEPGCQLDMVIAFQSPQGRLKSTGFQAMVPGEDWFTDGLSLHEDDDNFKRLLRGKVLVEVAEMAGLSKADIGLVKRVITRRSEEWIEKFKTHPSRFKRRCMLFASTNEPQFLPPDETGQRRWLPVEVTMLDRDRIAADRNQLWAEGAARWKQRREALGPMHGIAWQDAERLAAGRHARYEQTDVWETAIEKWLSAVAATGTTHAGIAPCARPLTIAEVLSGAIGLNTSHQDFKAEKRAARVLRQLGYERQSVRVDGATAKRWVKPNRALG
jgi:hypothetical protein